MKHAIFSCLAALTILALNSCCKEKPNKPDDMNVSGLPPVTQSGANTLGFLINGQPWTPAGPNNLSIDFDPGFNQGILGVAAYRTLSPTQSTQFVFGIRDSLNFMSIPGAKSLGRQNLGFMIYSNESFCTIHQNDTQTYASGYVALSKLDRQNRIIAGTFEGNLFNATCGDTVRITKGRFDLKF